MVGQCVHVDPPAAASEGGAQQSGVPLPPGHDRAEDRLAGAGSGELSLGEHRHVEAARLCRHQLVRGVLEDADEGERPLDRVRDPLGVREGAVEMGQVGRDVPRHQRAPELELGGEVVEEGALGRRRGVENLVDRGGREAVLDDEVLGGVEDAIPGGSPVSGHYIPCTRPNGLLQTDQTVWNANGDVVTTLLQDRRYVTDGGLETDLIFHHGVDLPEFASFPLDRAGRGARAPRAVLRRVRRRRPAGRRRPDARGPDLAGQPRLG